MVSYERGTHVWVRRSPTTASAFSLQPTVANFSTYYSRIICVCNEEDKTDRSETVQGSGFCGRGAWGLGLGGLGLGFGIWGGGVQVNTPPHPQTTPQTPTACTCWLQFGPARVQAIPNFMVMCAHGTKSLSAGEDEVLASSSPADTSNPTRGNRVRIESDCGSQIQMESDREPDRESNEINSILIPNPSA